MYKEDVVVVDKDIRTRGYEQFRRKNQAAKVLINWKKFKQPDHVLDTDYRLPTTEFFKVITAFQMDINYFIILCSAILTTRPMVTLFSILILSFILNLPTFMFYIFFGKYTRLGFLKIWDFVPALKGVGYVVLFVTLIQDMYMMSLAAFLINILSELIFNGLIFLKCDFCNNCPECIASKKEYRKKVYVIPCDKTILPSPALYIQRRYDEYMGSYYYLPHFGTVLILVLLWGITLCVSYQGFQKFAKYTNRLLCFAYSVGLIMCFLSFTMENMGIHENNWSTPNFGELSAQYYGSLLSLSILYNLPGNTIFVGAISSKGLNSGTISLFTIFIKIAISLFYIIIINLIMNTLNLDYNLGYIDQCTTTGGSLMLLGFVPDALSRMVFGKLLVYAYFIGLLFCCVVVVIYSTTANVESVIQELPTNVKRFRFMIFTGYVVIAFILNLLYIGLEMMFERINVVVYLLEIFVVCILIANIAIIFIYPISRLYSDYYFTYGSRPMVLWTTLWRICPIFMMFSAVVIMVQYQDIDLSQCKSQVTVYALYTISALFHIPIFAYMLWIIFRYFHSHKRKPIVAPEATWGPPNKELRIAREYFSPERDLKYLGFAPRCKHKCLILSEEYAHEVNEQMRKFNQLIHYLREKNQAT